MWSSPSALSHPRAQGSFLVFAKLWRIFLGFSKVFFLGFSRDVHAFSRAVPFFFPVICHWAFTMVLFSAIFYDFLVILKTFWSTKRLLKDFSRLFNLGKF